MAILLLVGGVFCGCYVTSGHWVTIRRPLDVCLPCEIVRTAAESVEPAANFRRLPRQRRRFG